MFVETYYGERAAAASASTGELTIPYPELSGEEIVGGRIDAVAKILTGEEGDKKSLLMVLWHYTSPRN
jgi:hypothetical protein